MNQSRAFFMSLAFAMVGMGLVALYISEQEKKLIQTHGEMVRVVIAKSNLNEMQSLDLINLDEQLVPASYVQPDAIKIDPSKAQNKEAGFVEDVKEIRGMVALVPIRQGEQIVLSKLSPKGAETGLAPQVAANKRAMSIMVNDETGVAKLIKPGDHVDIIGSISYPGADGIKQTELRTILQNITILATGGIITNNLPQVYEMDPLTQKKVGVSGRGDQNFSNITVEVTPDQAQVLIYAKEQGGQLYLTLRNPVDRVETNVGSTTVDEVLGPDSKRAQERDREQKRIADEARRLAELERLKALGTENARRPAADPLDSGGGVLE